MATKKSFGQRPSLGEMLLQHVIVFLICVVFPGLVTAMAPATWLTFARNEEGVRFKAWTCMFFVVPFQVKQVDQVEEIGYRENAGRTERQRKQGRTTNKYVEVDGEGFLQVHGTDDKMVEISVSPASLKDVVARSKKFLEFPQERTETIFAIANWKFGGLMGGVLSLFTALYVVGYSLGFLKFVITTLTKTIFGRR